MQAEGLTPAQFNHLINHESGLLGVSETSSDMRDLLDSQANDIRAAEAVDLFCYQTQKGIGAYAAVLDGLDTLVFSGGIGENAPEIRARICTGLAFQQISESGFGWGCVANFAPERLQNCQCNGAARPPRPRPI